MGGRSLDAFWDDDGDSAGEMASSGRGRRRSSESRGPEVIGGLFGGLKVAKSVKDHLKSIDLWTHWNDIVGTELSRVTAPKEFKAKSLTIVVAHQAWAHQLHFLTPSILNKIRAEIGRASCRERV